MLKATLFAAAMLLADVPADDAESGLFQFQVTRNGTVEEMWSVQLTVDAPETPIQSITQRTYLKSCSHVVNADGAASVTLNPDSFDAGLTGFFQLGPDNHLTAKVIVSELVKMHELELNRCTVQVPDVNTVLFLIDHSFETAGEAVTLAEFEDMKLTGKRVLTSNELLGR